ncbi:hypothetical protein MSS93_14825 [Deinococcus radiodurans]|nr:hypothetical protein MSS93_14825 [Deinococcus radiodurans]
MSLALLYAFAHFAGGVTLPLGLALLLAGKLLLGMIPLVALGLCIGFLASPQAAQILANILSVVMSFASGSLCRLISCLDLCSRSPPAAGLPRQSNRHEHGQWTDGQRAGALAGAGGLHPGLRHPGGLGAQA